MHPDRGARQRRVRGMALEGFLRSRCGLPFRGRGARQGRARTGVGAPAGDYVVNDASPIARRSSARWKSMDCSTAPEAITEIRLKKRTEIRDHDTAERRVEESSKLRQRSEVIVDP